MTQVETLSLTDIEFERALPSKIEVISPLVDEIMGFIAKHHDPGDAELDVELALREALANAIIHGNQGDPGKSVGVEFRYGAGEVTVSIRDEGPGFDFRAVPDPLAAENRMENHGRGIHLMKALMDDVRFEQNGRVVQFRKKLGSESL